MFKQFIEPLNGQSCMLDSKLYCTNTILDRILVFTHSKHFSQILQSHVEIDQVWSEISITLVVMRTIFIDTASIIGSLAFRVKVSYFSVISFYQSLLLRASAKPGVSTTVSLSLTPLSSISTVDASMETVFCSLSVKTIENHNQIYYKRAKYHTNILFLD